MKKMILKHLAGGVAKGRKSFDKKTGRFLAKNGGWATTLQDIIFPLALLYTAPGTKYHGDREVLKLCRGGGDALRDWQYDDGTFEFIKIDGSRWGPIYQPWTIYHWLEAYALLRDSLGNKRRARWEEGLRLSCAGLADHLKTPRAHNIPTWQGMSLVRAARVFDEPDWGEVGKAQIYFACNNQSSHGFWPEGDGPSTGYNLVYVHALGLHHGFTGDKRVLPALRRAAEFHALFTYPDGTPVETVDGRQRYHTTVSQMGWPGLLLSPSGRGLVRLLAESLRQPGSGGLSPHLAATFQHYCEGAEEPLPHEAKSCRRVHRGSALMRREGPWMLCASGYVPRPELRPAISRNRWIMTRANCLSVWHDKLGLLIGGGNSKHDPFFATFELWHDNGLHLEPEKVTFRQVDSCESIRFYYRKLACELSLRPVGAKRLEIRFALPAATARRAKVQAGFTLRLAPGSQVSWAASGKTRVKGEATLDPLRTVGCSWRPEGQHSKRTLKGEGWRLEMPTESAFAYPAYPFNPYAINDAAGAADAVGSVSAGFETGNERRFLLHVE